MFIHGTVLAAPGFSTGIWKKMNKPIETINAQVKGAL
jgi:hypothetical protein